MSEKRQPGNTLAWLLGIVLVPYVGVPLYLLLGGRKLRRLVARKSRLAPVPSRETAVHPGRRSREPCAHALVLDGACPPVGGNAVRLLTGGEQAYAEFERHIREARHTIHLMTFILGRDDTGRRIVELLAQRAREGVKVRLLLDAVGCLLSSRGFVEPIRRAGGEVQRFMPVLPLQWRGSANLRNHRKIAVFDHQSAILGGHNLARRIHGAGPPRNAGAISAPSSRVRPSSCSTRSFSPTGATRAASRSTLLHQSGGPAEIDARGTCDLQVVASGPDVAGDPLYEGIISFIQEAKRRIWIITPYFIPDEVIFRSLLVKARTGHEIKLVVPARSNHPITDRARRYYLRELQAAGVEVLLLPAGHDAQQGHDRRRPHRPARFRQLRPALALRELRDRRLRLFRARGGAPCAPGREELIAHSAPMPAERERRRLLGNIAEDLSRLFAPLL